MSNIRGISFLVVFAVAGILIGCEDEPQIYPEDTPAEAGGIQFELADYHIRYLELTDSGETIEYHDPVLAIRLDFNNVGDDNFTYNPTHTSGEMSQARTPLLYDVSDAPLEGADGYEVDWETFGPPAISGVRLEQGRWERQMHSSETVAPGEMVSDYFLFELPDGDSASLLLSIPPAMHRGELPVFIDFNYTRPEPEGPPVYEVGDTIEFDDVTFTVTAVTQEYVGLEDDSEGEGFSNDPVLKIAYTIENTSQEPISYDPAHGDLTGNQGPMVQSLAADFNRVRFPANTDPVGQVDSVDIEPGETVDDFATFELPGSAAETATFILPASHFDQSGRVRVAFSYEPEEVEEPEELQN